MHHQQRVLVIDDEDNMRHMLKAGIRLIAFVTRARTPMPESTENYYAECEKYRARCNC